MRRFIHGAALVALLLLVAGAGGVLVVRGAQPATEWQAFVSAISQRQIAVVCSGLAAVLLVLLYLLSGLRSRPRDQILSFPNEGGAVSLGVNGIADYLGKLSAEFSSVVSIRPKIFPMKDAMDVELDIKIKAGPDVRDVCELLQAQVRKSLLEGLGISNVRKVTVNVTEIVSGHKTPWRSET
jgi:uncharacterized alkaline shock family protein YloU